MRASSVLGIVLLLVGIISFFVAVPTSKKHDLKIGDASIGVTTHQDQKVPPVVCGILCAAGLVLLVAGSRQAA
jgi:hypothetical protein